MGNRNSLSALFLPKLSAEILAERLSVFKRSFSVLAEAAIFGRNSHFQQKYHLSADILANYFPETCGIFYRKSLFRQKQSLSAETPSFGSFGILAEMFLFEVLSFGYRQKEEISLSVAHYLVTIQFDLLGPKIGANISPKFGQ